MKKKNTKKQAKNSVYGAYNAYGYAVYVQFSNGDAITLYTAGNSRYDSQWYDIPGEPGALDLDTIRQFCEQTTKEMATEQGAVYIGIEHDTDSEKEISAPMWGGHWVSKLGA